MSTCSVPIGQHVSKTSVGHRQFVKKVRAIGKFHEDENDLGNNDAPKKKVLPAPGAATRVLSGVRGGLPAACLSSCVVK